MRRSCSRIPGHNSVGDEMGVKERSDRELELAVSSYTGTASDIVVEKDK